MIGWNENLYTLGPPWYMIGSTYKAVVSNLRSFFCILVSNVSFFVSLCGHHSLFCLYSHHLRLVNQFPWLFHCPGVSHCSLIIPQCLCYAYPIVSVHCCFIRLTWFCRYPSLPILDYLLSLTSARLLDFSFWINFCISALFWTNNPCFRLLLVFRLHPLPADLLNLSFYFHFDPALGSSAPSPDSIYILDEAQNVTFSGPLTSSFLKMNYNFLFLYPVSIK